MKHFFLPLICMLILSSFVSLSQNKNEMNSSIKPVNHINFSELSPDMKIQYQTDYLRHCLNQYRNQKLKGYCISLSGMAVAGVGVLLNPVSKNVNFYDDSNKRLMYFIGGGISLVGVFTVLNSEKWLKRAYIGPDGLGVKFTF